ncbi:Rne/Rng family ribonuclease [Gordoniibacillus kamchatkensis]|uniref:Rne/Rng family ribonuclease n=1 Tax=Gordoniibacillus kamchatkensis TaxID=1590651 RepID=UPI000696342D|nr:Rne/Rng family ribonuclease [Paenibacillus sp. VKM B-2647]
MKRIVLQSGADMTRVALLEDELVMEFDMDRPLERQQAGSVYLGRVVNVLPGMQAAFVDIGLEKNAFLYIDDLLPAHLEKQPAVKPSITELVKPGQTLIVQVDKEPSGTKGARVTTHYSLPGRWLVYMPQASYVAVSRKIEPDNEKRRLKTLGEQMRQGDEGIILRTVSAGQSVEALLGDLSLLREKWQAVLAAAQTAKAPSLLYRDADLLQRTFRDLIRQDVDDIVVDSAAAADKLRELLLPHAAESVPLIRVHDGAAPIFEAYGVNEQLEKAFRRKVWLPSGGYLIVDQTEALTVVDVNTGKYTGTVALEETVLHINLEAADAIARLLRLRNIGGIVIVDFIDMAEDANRSAVLARMTEAVNRDRIKTNVVGWTKLGLLELTRRKSRDNWSELFIQTCSHCQGKGRMMPELDETEPRPAAAQAVKLEK